MGRPLLGERDPFAPRYVGDAFHRDFGFEPELTGSLAETLLTISLMGDHLEIALLRHGEEALRRYTEQDIARFLEEDKLDEGTARQVRELLQRGEL